MTLAEILTPISIVIEFMIFIIGCYVGTVQKKPAGFLFAGTFMIFALYDFFNIIGFSQDMLAILNIIAVMVALGGIALLAQKT